MPKCVLCRARFASFSPGAGAGASICAIGGNFALAGHAMFYPFVRLIDLDEFCILYILGHAA